MKFVDNMYLFFARICHFFVDYQRCQSLRRMKQRFYTKWIGLEFGACGKKCQISKFQMLYGAQHFFLGDNVSIGKDVVFEAYDQYQNERFSPKIEMGNNTCIGANGHISCINAVRISSNVRMGRGVFITDNAHGASKKELLDTRPNIRPLYSKGPVVIEENVWIGEKVSIMPGVTIGKGSIIGANSVVTKDIPPYCVAGGVPAVVIKDLSKNYE